MEELVDQIMREMGERGMPASMRVLPARRAELPAEFRAALPLLWGLEKSYTFAGTTYGLR